MKLSTHILDPVSFINPATCSDLIVNYIQQLGIDTVFGIPGGAIEPLFNALARSSRDGGPKLVVARHECGAAFMADGYYRETGKMGVVCATTGPGTTNLITGICSAMAEHIPLLVITAQTALPKFGRRALQESSCTAIDTVAMMRYCTAFTSLVSHPEQLESKMISAIMAAHRNTPAPVHISVPSDVLNMTIKLPNRLHADLFSHDFALSDEFALDTLFKKVKKVDTIAVFIDEGVGSASRQVVRFCELVNAPFVVGQCGKYWVDETHPLYRGVYGFAGHQSARDIFDQGKPDLVIAVGASLNELSTGGWNKLLLNTKLVHIDNNVEHFTRSPMANHHVCGDVGVIFSKLNQFVNSQLSKGKQWLSCMPTPTQRNLLGTYASLENPCDGSSKPSKVKSRELFALLAHKVPKDTRVYMDAGNTWAWMAHYFVNKSYDGHVRSGAGFGAMGWAISAAIGSAIANPKKLTVCIVGDGAYLMSAQELSVAVQLSLPVVFIVLNDSAFGMVMHGQRLAKAESIGWELPEVNYALQARSLGAVGIEVKSLDKIYDMDFAQWMEVNGPVLLDVKIDIDDIPPIAQRVKGLNN